MKCISLWQPWASLLVLGSKQVETRSWSTGYRGPLLIHASKRKNIGELVQLLCDWEFIHFQEALRPLGNGPVAIQTSLPFGAIIGQVELVDCLPTESLKANLEPSERSFGNFAPGRFGWIMANPVLFEQAIPYKGSQGFFNVPDELIGIKI